MNTDHFMAHMPVREVCPMHEKALEVCDCDCTCGGPNCLENPECRFPMLQPRGYIRHRRTS